MSKNSRRKRTGTKKKRRKQGRAESSQYTTLAQHKRQGKVLKPPLMAVGGMQLASWLNDRLPEMIWGALIQDSLGRENGLGAIRAVAMEIHQGAEEGTVADATLSGIAALPEMLRDSVLRELSAPPAARKALRPLLLFPELPGRDAWAAAIGQEPVASDWNALMRAVALITDHQSQEATDLRWARVLAVSAAGRLHLPASSPEMADEILQYPNFGDQRHVRPFIRATEGAISGMELTKPLDAPPPRWAGQFWERCRTETPCVPAALPATISTSNVGTTLDQVSLVSAALVDHERRTRTTTAVDARHEGAFGIASYTLAILDELLRIGNATRILGRAGLRALLEAYITLAYLVAKDDPSTWQAYRSYGAGQAKLAFLKLDEIQRGDAADLPSHIDVKLLEALANEDRWLEYVDVNLGNWDGSNLRALSEEGGRKSEYDQFYGWTSAFIHGNWSAVRLVAYDLCANPLHRWHRILRATPAELGDVVPDATLLADSVLDQLNQLYPGLTVRLSSSLGV